MFIKFFPSTGKAVLVSEESDRVCTHDGGHDLSPENGARMGANGNECLHCGYMVGVEEFESVEAALSAAAFAAGVRVQIDQEVR